MVPGDLAKQVTAELDIPTVGIGAGPDCDAQVLVWQDMIGLRQGKMARFVKQYANLAQVRRDAAGAYVDEVATAAFPTAEHTFTDRPRPPEATRVKIGPQHRGVREHRATVPSRRQRVVYVPTMGALHAGHRSLIRLARDLGHRSSVSIFVNPLQFGPDEDYARYPRPLEDDLEICRAEGVDLVFVPTVTDLYPAGRQVTVSAGTMGRAGGRRPARATSTAC